MKFTVSSSALLKQLQGLQGVIARSNTLPVLDNFLFDLDKGKLSLTASDLETTVTATMPVEGNDTGAVTLPAKRLVRILRMLPGQHLAFSIGKDSRAKIKGEQGSYEVVGYAAGEYPKTPEVEAPSLIEIPASALSKGIGKTLWACGNDDLRPVMAGVFFDLTETGIRFVATDAHRLVILSRSDIKADKAASFILPKKAARILSKYLSTASGNVAVAFNADLASFAFDNISIIARLISGSYPRIDAVVPKDNTNTLTVDRMQLLGCMRRMGVFANTVRGNAAKFNLNGSIVVTSEDLDDDSRANERLAGTYKGEPMNIGFNARFMDEVLRNLNCQEVLVRMNKPNNAALFTPVEQGENEQITTLLMPVMLND